MPFNFQLMQSPWSAKSIRALVENLESALPQFGWPNYVLGNHDYPRLATRLGSAQARLAAMLLLTLRGTLTLYNGDELGLENGVISAEKVQDPQGKLLGAERTRDVARTPMQWDASSQAGFSSSEPWLPVSDDYQLRNVETELKDETSILNLYRQLIWFRRQTSALQLGDYRGLPQSNEDCYCFIRSYEGQEFLVVLNFGDRPQEMILEQWKKGNIIISTHMDRNGPANLSPLSLRPNEGLLISL